MNVYFLVEGRRTEKKVYPAWLRYLAPRQSRVDRFDLVRTNNYFIFSGEGYPSLLDVHLSNAIKDSTRVGCYTHFVVALDVDESTPDARILEVQRRAIQYGLSEESLRVIPQNCCFESWFLGNQRTVSTNPQSPRLAGFLNPYDVRSLDPELMPKMNGFPTRALFHYKYFHEIAIDKHFKYSKSHPGHVMDQVFVTQLQQRVVSTAQMRTLSAFFSLCEEINGAVV